jgi:hypothetical protein
MRSRLAAFLLCSFLTSAAYAVPVAYSESTGGDLRPEAATAAGPLPVGRRSRRLRSTSVLTPCPGAQCVIHAGIGLNFTDFDSFAFTIAPGNELAAGIGGEVTGAE